MSVPHSPCKSLRDSLNQTENLMHTQYFNYRESSCRSPLPPTKPREFSSARKFNYSLRKRRNMKQNQALNPIQQKVCDLINNLELSYKYNKVVFKSSSIKEKQSIYSEVSNIQPDETYEKLFCRIFKTRDSSSAVPMDKEQSIYLAHALQDTLAAINLEFPGYLDNPQKVYNNPVALQQELSIWLYIFSETIKQVSIHSKALAILLDTIQNRFVEFTKLIFFKPPEKEYITIDKIFESHLFIETKSEFGLFEQKMECLYNYFLSISSNPDEIDFLRKKFQKVKFYIGEQERLSNQIMLLKGEIERLQNDNKDLMEKCFELSMQKAQSDQSLQEIVKVNESIREQIICREHQIAALKEESEIMKQPDDIGMVPIEVQNVWYQISSFCKSLLNDSLNNLSLEQYFPPNLPSKKIALPEFSIPKPKFVPQARLHYQSFFTEIKTDFNGKIGTQIGNKFGEFLKCASEYYQKNFLTFKAEQTRIANKSIQKMNEIRSQQKDGSKWIQILLQHKEFLKLPKKIANSDDLANPVDTIKSIYYHTIENQIFDSSITQITIDFFKNNNPSLLVFLQQVATQSSNNIEIDIFQQFLLEKYPLHYYQFFAQIQFQSKNFGSFDHRSRIKLLEDTFSCVGWANISKQAKASYDSMFCSDTTKFSIFCLALYEFVIDSINLKIFKDYGYQEYQKHHQVDFNQSQNKFDSIDDALRNWFVLSDEKVYETIEFMKAICEDKSNPTNEEITSKELSVVLFKNKVKFDDFILSFEVENSALIQYLVTFGIKPKKKSTNSSQAPPSGKITVKKMQKNSTTQTLQ